MTQRYQVRGRRTRWLVIGMVLTAALAVGIPAAQASYSSTYARAENVRPHIMVAPTLSCSGVSATVTLTWSDSDTATADPHNSGTFFASGYTLERSVKGASFTQISTPGGASTGTTDSAFSGLAVLDTVVYRLRTTKASTLWQSSNSNTVTATVTGTSPLFLISCT